MTYNNNNNSNNNYYYNKTASTSSLLAQSGTNLTKYVILLAADGGVVVSILFILSIIIYLKEIKVDNIDLLADLSQAKLSPSLIFLYFRRKKNIEEDKHTHRLVVKALTKKVHSRRFMQTQWKNIKMSLIHVSFFGVFWAPYTIHQAW